MSADDLPEIHGPTQEQRHYLTQLDGAVADLVDIIRAHLPECRIPGVCVGEAADIIASMPARAVVDMMCQLALREATYRGQTPPYVHRILDAWISADPLDFERAYVPDDVRDRIVVAVQEGRVRVRPGDPE